MKEDWKSSAVDPGENLFHSGHVVERVILPKEWRLCRKTQHVEMSVRAVWREQRSLTERVAALSSDAPSASGEFAPLASWESAPLASRESAPLASRESAVPDRPNPDEPASATYLLNLE
jgi:hypothetical protein